MSGFLEVLKLLFQQVLNLSSSQQDMSGQILGDLSNNRWSRRSEKVSSSVIFHVFHMSTPDISPIDCYKKKKAVSPLVPWPMDALTVDYIQIQFSKKTMNLFPAMKQVLMLKLEAKIIICLSHLDVFKALVMFVGIVEGTEDTFYNSPASVTSDHDVLSKVCVFYTVKRIRSTGSNNGVVFRRQTKYPRSPIIGQCP